MHCTVICLIPWEGPLLLSWPQAWVILNTNPDPRTGTKGYSMISIRCDTDNLNGHTVAGVRDGSVPSGTRWGRWGSHWLELQTSVNTKFWNRMSYHQWHFEEVASHGLCISWCHRIHCLRCWDIGNFRFRCSQWFLNCIGEIHKLNECASWMIWNSPGHLVKT